jgi:hypothetical protein
MTRAVGCGLVAASVLLAAFGRAARPEDVALEYGRAIYASDAEAAWRLISEADRQVKDKPTFRRQQQALQGLTRDAVRQLAGYITATPVTTTIAGDRASVTLRFRLPDANAPTVRTLMLDWDEKRLAELSAGAHERLAARLGDLHARAELPAIEGDETIELVREYGRWHVFLNWAGGVRVAFTASVDPALPLDVNVTPSSAVLAPGERVRVTVRAKNTDAHEVTTRVTHRIEPDAEAHHLALLQCPLLLPARLAPGGTEEYDSEYLLLAKVPAGVRAFTVTYRFPAVSARRP